MELEPYIFFYGRCEEALAFYKRAVGGDYEVMRNADSPATAEPVPEERKQKVMHATFRGAGFRFMASDGHADKAIDPEAGNISLSLSTEDADEGARVFKNLAADGAVRVPLGEAFWGGKFGMVTDKFGIDWMVTTS
ncbi:MAG: VOC family protein [Candidatus Eremiobacteraeota bacterium]|nr:VOC family protein [Candidatus Eremiobacteraeota bacterium]